MRRRRAKVNGEIKGAVRHVCFLGQLNWIAAVSIHSINEDQIQPFFNTSSPSLHQLPSLIPLGFFEGSLWQIDSAIMSAPGGAPSPAPRSGSIGPGGNAMPMPQQSVNSPTTSGPPPPPSGAMSQQNLNQIVSGSDF